MKKSKETKNKVLILSYKFPPINSPGIYRILGFIRHLPEYNFEPSIVTAKNTYGNVKDIGLLKEVPKEIIVYRTFSFEIERIKEKLYHVLFEKNNDRKSDNMDSSEKKINSENKTNIFFSFWRSLFELFFIPDTRTGWFPTAFSRSLMLCLTRQVDLIFTSSPPDSLHLAGFLLK
jgi:hypothetical protein